MELFIFRPLSTQDDYNYNKFMSKIVKDGRINDELSQCWSHITGPSSSGYGQIMFQRKAWGLHVYSYWIHNGKPELPKGYHVSHACDNKECSNPEHLSLKTIQENIIEAVERIRVIKPKKKRKKGTIRQHLLHSSLETKLVKIILQQFSHGKMFMRLERYILKALDMEISRDYLKDMVYVLEQLRIS